MPVRLVIPELRSIRQNCTFCSFPCMIPPFEGRKTAPCEHSHFVFRLFALVLASSHRTAVRAHSRPLVPFLLSLPLSFLTLYDMVYPSSLVDILLITATQRTVGPWHMINDYIARAVTRSLHSHTSNILKVYAVSDMFAHPINTY